MTPHLTWIEQYQRNCHPDNENWLSTKLTFEQRLVKMHTEDLFILEMRRLANGAKGEVRADVIP